MSTIEQRPMRYALAVLLATGAIGLTRLPTVGPQLIGMLFCAIFLSAWYGGRGPGLVATGLIVGPVIGVLFLATGLDVRILALLPLAQFLIIGVLISFLMEALQTSRRRATQNQLWLAAVLRSIGDAVITVDPSGTITFLNGVAEALTGYAGGEAVGRPLGEVFRIVSEETHAPVDSPVEQVLEEGSIDGPVGHRLLVARDGTTIPVADNAAPIRSRDGRIIGVVIVFRDISERRRSEMALDRLNAELREDDRRKDEFLAMLAHELRNPLAAINNAVNLATRTQQREHIDWSLEVAARQIRHLSRLIDDLLDVSRITRGKIELRRQLVNPASILEHAVEMASPWIEKRRHELTVSIDDRDLWVDADPTRLEQVVVNLLTNAAKYTEDGGRIALSAARLGDEVVISVRDNGTGIAPERLPAIFELFEQEDRSLARSDGGLGIGLTVVKTLAEMHGGRISAASAGRGCGSEFTVHLPAMEAPRPSSRTLRDRETTAPPASGARILVVDDNVDTAKTLSKMLSLAGHEVRTAHDGLAGLEIARSFTPEWILLDIGLPGMDGYEVARALRAETSSRKATIIAISGYGGEADRHSSRLAGIDHHLVKPVDYDALMTLLKSRGRAEKRPISEMIAHRSDSK